MSITQKNNNKLCINDQDSFDPKDHSLRLLPLIEIPGSMVNAIVITQEKLDQLSSILKNHSVTVGSSQVDLDIILNGKIEWNSVHDLKFISKGNIILKEGTEITSKNSGSLYLKAGINNANNHGRVFFEGDKQIHILKSKAYIYYNSEKGDKEHKYFNPFAYYKHVEPQKAVMAYMLVNDVKDLQDINLFLHGNYALSKDIDAKETEGWNNGDGFMPITTYVDKEVVPFSGNFDGNGFSIKNLHINKEKNDDVGLFGIIAGQKHSPATINNLKLEGINIKGDHYVGGVTGEAENAHLANIELGLNNIISGRAIVGGIVGSATNLKIKDIVLNENLQISSIDETKGTLVGVTRDHIHDEYSDICSTNLIEATKCIGYEE